MGWEVEYTHEFGQWWDDLTVNEQISVAIVVKLLEACGPSLPYPYSSGVRGSRYGHMRELRIQSAGNPLRAFYAFDPRRTAILLLGGDKTGDDAFYRRYIPIADKLYEQHLADLPRGD